MHAVHGQIVLIDMLLRQVLASIVSFSGSSAHRPLGGVVIIRLLVQFGPVVSATGFTR